LLRRRARNELRAIDAVARKCATVYTVLSLLKGEPAGGKRLLQLLYRISEPARDGRKSRVDQNLEANGIFSAGSPQTGLSVPESLFRFTAFSEMVQT